MTGESQIRAKFKYPFTFWVDSRGGAELGVAKRNETEVRLRQVLVRDKQEENPSIVPAAEMC